MGSKQYVASSSRLSTSKFPKDLHLRVCGQPIMLNSDIMASRSAKLDKLLKENHVEDIPGLLGDIPADPKTFEIVARFCYGYEIDITTANVIRVCCVADYLEMTESHSLNNLLVKAITFFKKDVIPFWNCSVRALKSTENVLQQVLHLGLIDALFESIITKVLADPCLLGKPIKCLTFDGDGEKDEDLYRTSARRRLFGSNLISEDLATLSVQLYEPIIHEMILHQVPSENVAASLCQYVENWVSATSQVEGDVKGMSQRAAIEAVERLLPHERELFPCNLLFEMLQFAIALEATTDCRNGFEVRIGKQLDQATVSDLLIPGFGYAREQEYDTDCIRRILKHFYSNLYTPDNSSILKVAELFEHYLAEVASDVNLKKSTFMSLAETAFAASAETQRLSDGLYKAISIYLDNHTYLTEYEKEDICKLLDCSKMSPEACEHAATNKRLPLRIVVNVLFVHQLHLRDTFVKEVTSSDDGLVKPHEEEISKGVGGSSKDRAMVEMERMNCKVTDLEKECSAMKKEICGAFDGRLKREKGGMWREMKRKLRCISTTQDYDNCHVKKKKVHPK
ncbi:BTB/POZ domain-containing protein [Heracleum sosnowskyi]|uniref:BTB/POZ domain-containing protein n=1 Tax=Heracleum sosnowskyi TaxID=360622 RepID=A0AAD8JF03_9APIA|nr:BTB/POZ domain-containing protein [Heracleum sosnowskyi]